MANAKLNYFGFLHLKQINIADRACDTASIISCDNLRANHRQVDGDGTGKVRLLCKIR